MKGKFTAEHRLKEGKTKCMVDELDDFFRWFHTLVIVNDIKLGGYTHNFREREFVSLKDCLVKLVQYEDHICLVVEKNPYYQEFKILIDERCTLPFAHIFLIAALKHSSLFPAEKIVETGGIKHTEMSDIESYDRFRNHFNDCRKRKETCDEICQRIANLQGISSKEIKRFWLPCMKQLADFRDDTGWIEGISYEPKRRYPHRVSRKEMEKRFLLAFKFLKERAQKGNDGRLYIEKACTLMTNTFPSWQDQSLTQGQGGSLYIKLLEEGWLEEVSQETAQRIGIEIVPGNSKFHRLKEEPDTEEEREEALTSEIDRYKAPKKEMVERVASALDFLREKAQRGNDGRLYIVKAYALMKNTFPSCKNKNLNYTQGVWLYEKMVGKGWIEEVSRKKAEKLGIKIVHSRTKVHRLMKMPDTKEEIKEFLISEAIRCGTSKKEMKKRVTSALDFLRERAQRGNDGRLYIVKAYTLMKNTFPSWKGQDLSYKQGRRVYQKILREGWLEEISQEKAEELGIETYGHLTKVQRLREESSTQKEKEEVLVSDISQLVEKLYLALLKKVDYYPCIDSLMGTSYSSVLPDVFQDNDSQIRAVAELKYKEWLVLLPDRVGKSKDLDVSGNTCVFYLEQEVVPAAEQEIEEIKQRALAKVQETEKPQETKNVVSKKQAINFEHALTIVQKLKSLSRQELIIRYLERELGIEGLGDFMLEITKD